MVRDPRAAFDMLFGVGATPRERAAVRRADKSILDWVSGEIARLGKELGPADRRRLADYLDNVREMAAAGADFISIGALTHSAPAADLSMEVVPFAAKRRTRR